MDRRQADALVSHLGDVMGIAGLALDEHGCCTIALDKVVVNIGHRAGGGSMELMTCLDEVKVEGPLLAQALAANFGWRVRSGATFAVEPSGCLVLQRRLVDEAVSGEGLAAAIQGMAEAAEEWTARFGGAKTGADPVPDIPPGSLRL